MLSTPPPKAKFVPAPRHSSSCGFLLYRDRFADRENESRTLSRSRLVPFFFFAPLADTLEIDDRRETRGYFWRARGNAISYLARFSQLDVIFHACLVVRAESRESPSPLNITAFLQHASKSCKTILEEEEEEEDRFGGGKREIR